MVVQLPRDRAAGSHGCVGCSTGGGSPATTGGQAQLLSSTGATMCAPGTPHGAHCNEWHMGNIDPILAHGQAPAWGTCRGPLARGSNRMSCHSCCLWEYALLARRGMWARDHSTEWCNRCGNGCSVVQKRTLLHVSSCRLPPGLHGHVFSSVNPVAYKISARAVHHEFNQRSSQYLHVTAGATLGGWSLGRGLTGPSGVCLVLGPQAPCFCSKLVYGPSSSNSKRRPCCRTHTSTCTMSMDTAPRGHVVYMAAYTMTTGTPLEGALETRC